MISCRRFGAIVTLALAAGLAVAVAEPPPLTGRSAATPAPTQAQVTLQGEGSWDPIGEMSAWQTDLYGSGAINLNYLANGGYAGRQDYLAGGLDYVISGVPFTQPELAMLAHGANDLIDAPVQVSALGVLVGRPFTQFETPGFGVFRQVCDPDNPPNPLPPGVADGSVCGFFVPYTGPVRVPPDNLSAMLIQYGAISNWDNPSVEKAFGVTVKNTTDFMNGSQDAFIPQHTGPINYLRSDPSESSFYLQQYLATAAPATWAGYQAQVGRTFGPITERLPFTARTRPGVDQQITRFEGDAIVTSGNPGVVIPVPPWALNHIQHDGSKAPAEWVQLQNAVPGDWVVPTPASIDAAVNAGGDTPMYALTHQVPGAYPIVYVNHLYAPAHGLSIAKTEALATTIRYLVTAGQAAAAPVGDGQLSPALVSQALAAANHVVQSNCTGANATITTSSDPGPLAPELAALKGIGQMLHCVANATTSPTTQIPTTVATAPARSPTAAIHAPAVASGGSGSTSPGAAQATQGTAAATTTAPATAAASPPPPVALTSAAIALAKLPLPVPGSGVGQFDRFTALIIGAALLLLARKPVRLLAKALQG